MKAASFTFESTIEAKKATEEKSIDGDIQSILLSNKPIFKHNGLNFKVASRKLQTCLHICRFEYANLFAKKYTDILGEGNALKFIEVFIVDIQMNGEYKTMERCLNKNMYKLG